MYTRKRNAIVSIDSISILLGEKRIPQKKKKVVNKGDVATKSEPNVKRPRKVANKNIKKPEYRADDSDEDDEDDPFATDNESDDEYDPNEDDNGSDDDRGLSDDAVQSDDADADENNSEEES